MMVDIPNPKVEYYYINATAGKVMRYDGSEWKNLGSNENIMI